MTTPISRDRASALFFDGTARGELLLRRCEGCRHLAAPPVTVCPTCASTDLVWQRADGRATLVCWAIRRAADTETVAGIVELREGPWLRARVVGCAPERLAAGLPLRVRFDRPAVTDPAAPAPEAVPVFTPDEQRRTTPDE
ncbi:Zn-ribbon domain-containing OB-fold protein [Nocardia sp. SSK8]|uniref:Zn-ribbon domain-containing OB-fold protein n=1 Tax=Nocardia sp. SSK8 TaxID=3120154 RepID=UPI00300AE427